MLLNKFFYQFFHPFFFPLQHMVQTGMAAPYGGGVFPPPVNGVAGVVGGAGAAGEVGKLPTSVPVVKVEENTVVPQQPPPQVVPPNAAIQHPSAPGQPTQPSFSPPPPPNGVEQQTIVSLVKNYRKLDRKVTCHVIPGSCSISINANHSQQR